MKFLATISALIVAAAASPAPAAVARPANLSELEARTILNAPVTVTCWDQINFKGNSVSFYWEEGAVCFPITGPVFHNVKSCCVCAPAANSGAAGYKQIDFGAGVDIVPLHELGSGYSDRLHDGCYSDLFEFNNQIGGLCVWTHA